MARFFSVLNYSSYQTVNEGLSDQHVHESCAFINTLPKIYLPSYTVQKCSPEMSYFHYQGNKKGCISALFVFF